MDTKSNGPEAMRNYLNERTREVLNLLAITEDSHIKNYVYQNLKMGFSVQSTVRKTKRYLRAE